MATAVGHSMSGKNEGLAGWLLGAGLNVATLVVLLISGVVLPFTYWYLANRPNVNLGVIFDRAFVTVEIRNDGRVNARDFLVTCPQLLVGKDKRPLQERFEAIHPQQAFKYFIGVGYELVDHEPYSFTLKHRRWIFGGRTVKQETVDFSSYRHVLAAAEPPSKLLNEVVELGRTTDALLKWQLQRKDRWSYRRMRVNALLHRLRNWPTSRSHGRRARHE